MYVNAAPNFERTNVIGGFVLSPPASGLTPAITIGVLFAQGIMYRPDLPPVLPSAPPNQRSWLYYNSIGGFYWRATQSPTDPEDAFLGWAVANATDVIAVSRQLVWVPDPSDHLNVIPLGDVLPPGSGAGGPPGVITYTPVLRNYGLFGIKDLAIISGNKNVSLLEELHLVLAYVDETRASHLYGQLTADVDASTDPLVISPTIATDDASSFAPGDYIVFRDESQDALHPAFRSYESAQIAAIDEDGTFHIQRHYPGADADRATFESYRTPHAAGTRFYRVQLQHFPIKIRGGAFSTDPPLTPSGIAAEHYVTWPNACVVATIAAVANASGYGPWTVVNCAFVAYPYPGDAHQVPPAPGMRTLTGGQYLLPLQGDLAVGVGLPVRVPVRDPSGVAVAYSTVAVAPSGAGSFAGVMGTVTGAVVIYVLYVEPISAGLPGDRRVGIIDQIVIADNAVASFDSSDAPRDRRMPYGRKWPPSTINQVGTVATLYTAGGAFNASALPLTLGAEMIMEQDGELDVVPARVGSTTPGANAMVTVQT